MSRDGQCLHGWIETTLGALAHYINGYAFGPEDWGDTGFPIIRIQQINDPEAGCDYFDGPIADHYCIDNGDLLFSWSATLTTLIWDRGPALLNQHIFKVIPREGTDLHFLHHLLDYSMDDLAGQTHGSTMKHIKRSDLLPLPVVVPPLPEQRRIAEILDAADEAIRQTERLIAKLKAVKAGLLHDLLTCGLDEHGRLRDPQAHPEQFKDSPLGRIPWGWEVRGLPELMEPHIGVKPGPFGSSITKSMYTSEGYRVYGQEQAIAGDLSVGDYYISRSKYLELQSFAVQEGDLLISLVGTIGELLVVRSPFEPGIINPRLIRLRPDRSECDVEFLKHALGSALVYKQLSRMAQGGTMPVLSGKVLKKLRLTKPSLDEQRRIAAVLDAHDTRIRAEEATLAKLRQAKRGLMDDLLTGRVGTNPM